LARRADTAPSDLLVKLRDALGQTSGPGRWSSLLSLPSN
jgi:hypothetical protein